MIPTRMTAAMALGGFILIAAATLKYAQAENAISPEVTRRSMQVLFGLMLAAYANVIPKDIGNWQASTRAVARSQSVLRVGGWSLTLAGLAYAGLWAFAPLAVADVAAMPIVASALLITMGFGAWTVMVCRSEKRSGLNSEGQL
jgi:hypothetical protein